MNCIRGQTRGVGARDESREKRASCRFTVRPGVTHVGETGGTLPLRYIVIDTTSRNGFPQTIRRIVYEGTPNAANTAPSFCGVNATIVSTLDIDGDCIVGPLTDGL